MKALTIDRKIGYCVSLAVLAFSFLPLLLPEKYALWTAGIIFILAAAGASVLIKKRCILSYNKGQVLLIVATIAALYLMLFYLSGFRFGFARSSVGILSLKSFLAKIFPIALIIVGTELVRFVILSDKGWQAWIIAYAIGVSSALACLGTIPSFRSIYEFADFFGMTIFPALTSNLLFNYLSKRYGIVPSLVYRLILTLYTYIIPILPVTPDIISAFGIMVLPLITLAFIDVLFNKKRKRAKARKGVLRFVFTAAVGVAMVLAVMLISCQFRFGIIVIATESMTGEINKGDAVVFESSSRCRQIEEGDVIIFEENDRRLVHRVVKIDTVNGEKQYITKGDANEGIDPGYRTDSTIVGLVRFKVLYVGLPTIWLREALIKR